MDVLVVNVGSSTVKLHVVAPDGSRRRSTELDGAADLDELDRAIAALGAVDAVGHRIVQGGPHHVGPERVTDELLDDLDTVAELAPLHDPPAIDMVRRVRRARPELEAVVCFDTAFHATLPPSAYLYAVPREWTETWGIRRYGFHGLSHRYAAHRAADLLGRQVRELKVVTCHLGSGASLAAVDGGRCIDTTMGFTPVAGLVMATRSGDVDPGALLWLQQRAGLTAAEVEDALLHRSGLAGLCGGSGDMRSVLAGADAGDELCAQALDVYVHRLRAGIAAMAVALGGLDVVVFTGGVGEHAAAVRAETAAGLALLGVAIDADANQGVDVAEVDADITGPGATAVTLVVAAREDQEIAREVRTVLA